MTVSQQGSAASLELRGELEDEPALADPWNPHEGHQLGLTLVLDAKEGLPKQPQLLLAANERRPARAAGAQSGAGS